MFGDAQTVINRAIATFGKQTRGGAQFCRWHAGQQFGCLWAVTVLGYEFSIFLEFIPITTGADKLFVHQTFGNDDMGQRRDNRDICTRAQWQVMRRFDMCRFHQIDPTWINDDQLCTFAQTFFQTRCKHRVAVSRIGPNDDHDISMFNAVKVLRSRRRTKGLPQTVTRRRMAYAGTGICVVVAKNRAGQFLHKIGLFVCAPARGNHTNRFFPVFFLQSTELVRRKGQCFVPADFAPWFVNRVTDHRVEDTILMGRIAIGKATFDAGMTTVCRSIFKRYHADQLIALQFGLERTTNTAIGTGCDNGSFGRAQFNDRFFNQGARWAGLDASAAADAIGG